MSTVSCTDSDKERFESIQEDSETQAEAFKRVLDMAEAFNGEIVDESKVAEQTAELMGPKLELALYRVVDELADQPVEVTLDPERLAEVWPTTTEEIKELAYNE